MNQKNKNQEFGFTIAYVLLALSWWLGRSGHNRLVAPVLIGSLAFLFFAIFTPDSLKRLCEYWFRGASLLGNIVGGVILSIIYIVLITPYALILRAFGKKYFDYRFKSGAGSYFVERGSWHKSTQQF